MIMPVRCFTCGKPIAQLWEDYSEKTKKGEDANKVLEKLGVERYCCKRMFLAHKEYIDDLMLYEYK